mgnify:CR=1 FL=1
MGDRLQQIADLEQRQNELFDSKAPNYATEIRTLQLSIDSLKAEQPAKPEMSVRNLGTAGGDAATMSLAGLVDSGIGIINTLDFRGPPRDDGGFLIRDDLGRPKANGPLFPFSATDFLKDMGFEGDSTEILGQEHGRWARAIDHSMDSMVFALPIGKGMNWTAAGIAKIPSMRKYAEPFTQLNKLEELFYAGAGGFAGGYFGDEENASLGAEILTPLGIQGGFGTIKMVAQRLIPQMRASDVSNEAAAELLNQALENSGLTLQEAVDRYAELGAEGMLVDTDDAFRNLVRSVRSSGVRPGQINQVLRRRVEGDPANMATTGRAGRMNDEVNVYLGNTDGNTYIRNLENENKENIDKLYQQARTSIDDIPAEVNEILETKSEAMQDAIKFAKQNYLNATGKKEFDNNFDFINAVKQALDDEISKVTSAIDPTSSQRAKANGLIALQNRLLTAADDTIEGFAEARSAFAGVFELKNKVELGRNIFTRNVDSELLRSSAENWGDSDLAAFKIGARDAILDMIMNSPSTGDVAKRIVRNPEVQERLRVVFGDDELEQFTKILQREGEFMRTHREITTGSQTFDKYKESSRMHQSISNVLMATGNPMGQMQLFAQTISNLAKGTADADHRRALIMANDILLNSNLSPEAVRDALTRGEVRQLVPHLAFSIFGKENLPANVINIIRQPARTVGITEIAQMATRERDAMEAEQEANARQAETDDLLASSQRQMSGFNALGPQ